jgi:ATP-dependent DNA ligase
VNFAFGRRGSTLNTGTKTSTPVAFSNARAVYEKLVREKKAKGYTEGEAGVPYEHAGSPNEHSGISPQLLNPLADNEVEALLDSNAWCMQEKFDGKRLLVRKIGSTIVGINRRGLIIGLPGTISDELANIHADFILDGESVNDRYFVFDLLIVRDADLRRVPYRSRLADLVRLIGFGTYEHVQTVPSFITSDQKRAFMDDARRQKKEGVVFKHLEAPYTPGRPASAGTQLKYKFISTLSAQVTRVNNGRSVGLSLLGSKGWQSCGNVTIPVNHPLPHLGQVVEVRYLYAFPESGALFQPVYLGVRSDLEVTACTTDQLKFKASGEVEP